MKRLPFLLLSIMLWMSGSALAQHAFTPYYVVIGGFASEENAQRHCTHAQEQNLPAVYAYNAERKIYYVYVRATTEKEVADDIRERLQAGSVFRDAWVFNGNLSGSTVVPPPAQPTSIVAETSVSPPDPITPPEIQELEEPAIAATPEPPAERSRPVGRPFIFNLLSKETGKSVSGLVHLQVSERAQQFRGVNGNEVVYVPAPANRSGKWFVNCHVLGYKPFREHFTYDKADAFEGASRGVEEAWVLPLVLERVRRGDYIEMPGVKFYNNAALFTPGSERQLDELVAMLEENSAYEIRLHGHVNGDDEREVVSLGESDDLFNPNASNSREQASAKTLSQLRADLVKMYLVRKGIDADRVVTKGEGGKQMIADPRGTLAGMNDRVEVEIRKH